MRDRPLQVALKEWATVCELIAAGRCALLLRKGGIHEDAGPGRFRLDHDRFALMPATEHERVDWIKPAFRAREQAPPGRPETVRIDAFADVAGVWEVPSRAAFDTLDDLHPWEVPQIDMRFSYKPDRPIYLVALRAFRFDRPHDVPYTDAYLGCRSWVDLDAADAVPSDTVAAATPAMPDDALAGILDRIHRAFS